MAVKLEQVATKDEILSMYLNEIPYGGVIYGVEEASEAFFGKKSSAITLAEAAIWPLFQKRPHIIPRMVKTKINWRKEKFSFERNAPQ